jgi:hypothetical protein
VSLWSKKDVQVRPRGGIGVGNDESARDVGAGTTISR